MNKEFIMRGLIQILYISTLTSVLLSCGGSDGPTAPTSANLTGVFLDSPVQGLKYSTNTLSGLTNAQGQFEYKAGEVVTFTLGGIVLGQADGVSTITPSDLSHAGLASPSPQFNNILRLLQSLDEDCNANNGIVISEAMQLAAENISFDLTRTKLEFENDETLLGLLSESTCAQTWVSQLQAETHFRISMQEEMAELLQKIALITPEGETEPKIAVDDEGNAIYLLPGDAENNESSVIMLQGASDDALYISVDNEGLPKNIIFADGTIIILRNQTGESVDLFIDSPDESIEDITLRIELTDAARLAFSMITNPPVPEVASVTHYKNNVASPLFDFFISKANAADDATQVLSNGMKNAGAITDYIIRVGEVVEVTYSGHSKAGLLVKTGVDVIKNALLKAALNQLTPDKDQQRVAELSFSALTCAGALNVAACGKLAFDSASVAIEFGGIIYDIGKDWKRIAALEAELATIDFQTVPLIVSLDYANNGKIFSVIDSITFSASAFDPNEGASISPNNLLWSSSQDGELGTGESISVSGLSLGIHVITVTATAWYGEQRTSRLSIEVGNKAPEVTASTASKEFTYIVGDTIILTGTVVDPEGESLPAEAIEWRTSVGDRLLGHGLTVVVSDLEGPDSNDPEATVTHQITFSASDSYGEVGTTTIGITITNNGLPFVNTTARITDSFSGCEFGGGTYNEIWALDPETLSVTMRDPGGLYIFTGTYNPETKIITGNPKTFNGASWLSWSVQYLGGSQFSGTGRVRYNDTGCVATWNMQATIQ